MIRSCCARMRKEVAWKCCGQLAGFAANTAGKCYTLRLLITALGAETNNSHSSELAEPHKLLPYLLQPGIAKLSPDTVAVYLQSASKIFAFWAADLADRWDDDRMPEVKIAVESIITGLEPFNQNADIEIQERVRMIVRRDAPNSLF